MQTSTSAKGLSDSIPKAEIDKRLKDTFVYIMTDNSGKISFGNTDNESSVKKYYQVTSKQNAETIINSNNPELKGREFKEVYVWTKQPTYKQAENSGARYLETVIEFETNATFSKDTSICDTALHNIARVSDRPGPIPISNVVEVGFKSEKRWWQFWKE